MYFFLGTHTEPLGAQILNEKQFINLLWTAESVSLMQRSNTLCFKHHHSEKGTRTATFRMPSDSAGILIGMTATRALISLAMIQAGLTGILSSWDAVEQEICADVFLQDEGSGVPLQNTGQSSKFSHAWHARAGKQQQQQLRVFQPGHVFSCSQSRQK